MKNPNLIPMPFAKDGQKDDIPATHTSELANQKATWDVGFPPITMLPVTAGGLPPSGRDFNGILNQISENIVHLSKGGKFKFSTEYTEQIGGYQKGAILQSDDESKEYQSLIDNNKINFNIATQDQVNAAWKLVNTSSLIDNLNKKLNKSDVLQSAGQSTTQVISQKAVTDYLNTKQDKGDYATNSALNDVRALANTANNNANTKLAKSQNGADIPNKSEFVKNLGLLETVNLAKNAVPNSRKINGKALTGDISLSAGDVGAFSDFRGYVSNNSRFSDIRESGIYCVAIDNPNSVTDLPTYNNVKIYSYGFLSVFKSNDQRIHQTYYSHQGDIATRQTWDGPERYKPWTTQYSTANPALPVGVPLPYPHRYTPAGYLTCNGQTFDKSLYPRLAEAYPSGRVPDLRGEFIRGWDDSRGVDPGRVCGSWQGDAIQNITGGFTIRRHRSWSQLENVTGCFNSKFNSASGLAVNQSAGETGADNVTFDASRVVPTANENRPRNVAFNYIVRAI